MAFYVYATADARQPVTSFNTEAAALAFCDATYRNGVVSTSPQRVPTFRAYYLFNPRLNVVATFKRLHDEQAEMVRRDLKAGYRLIAVDGRTVEQAEDFLRDELYDDTK
jgi:hypothetical protein